MKNVLTKIGILLVIVIMPFMLVACSGGNNTPSDSTFNAINHSMRSMMVIESDNGNGTMGSSGSGVIYKINGNEVYIITNWHVIALTENSATPATRIFVSPSGVKEWVNGSYQTISEWLVNAEVVGGSVDYDICILKATLPANYIERFSLRAVDVALFNDAIVGDEVFAIGNAVGQGMSVSDGIVSVASEEISGDDIDSANSIIRRVMRTTAAVQSGNSGGGLFNSNGELVAIVQSKMMYYGSEPDQNPADNLAYAVPIEISVRVAEQMVQRDMAGEAIDISLNGGLVIKTVGITLSDRNEEMSVDKNGENIYIEEVYVTEVDASARIGLMQDDIILSVECGNQKLTVTHLHQIREFLISHYNQSALTIEVLRAGVITSVTGNFID